MPLRQLTLRSATLIRSNPLPSLAIFSYISLRTAVVDHNIYKHLNISKQSDMVDENGEMSTLPREKIKAPILLMDQSSHIERNKKFTELDQVPVPSFEQKKKLREEMFFYLEDATIEETRLVTLLLAFLPSVE